MPLTDSQPRLFLTHLPALADARDRIAAGDSALRPAVDLLRRQAGEALAFAPVSVVDKPVVPPSGDKHDYMSVGPYWWPNPDTPNGLPYVRRDGEVNPDRHKYDNVGLGAVCHNADTLALASYLFRDPRYAAHAVRLLRVWFLDAATRMNPHLEYGQAIPGICDGRDIGIIDTSGSFPRLVDAIGLLEVSGAMEEMDRNSLLMWMRAYREWLQDSAHGQGERGQHNNHGTYYDVQLAALALYTGDLELALKVCRGVPELRIAAQIRPDGSQPHELARTRSWSYSLMNTRGFMDLATLAEHVGENLWSFETADGRGIRKAVDWFIPFLKGERTWTWRQISPFDQSAFVPVFKRASAKLEGNRYHEMLSLLPAEAVASHRVNLTLS